jgi:hypothetical protein
LSDDGSASNYGHQVAILGISTRSTAYAQEIPREELAEIAEDDPAVATMMHEWRGEAPERLGLVRARLWEILHDLPTDDKAVMLGNWFLDLPPSARAAIMRVLGSDRIDGGATRISLSSCALQKRRQ